MQENKNVLVLASTFPVSDEDKVPSFVKDQIISLKKQYPHLNFKVISPSNKNTETNQNKFFTHYKYKYFFKRFEKFETLGILPTLRKNYLYFFLIPFFIFAQMLYTKKFIKNNHVDIIYAHWITPQALTALLIKKLYTIPFVFTSHSQDANVLVKIPLIGTLLLNSIVKNSSKFTCVSQSTENNLKKHIKSKNWNDNKSLIYPMGIRDYLFDEINEEKPSHFINKENIVFSFIGRFTEIKGVENTIIEFSKLIKEYNNITFLINGSGELKNKYLSLIKKLGVEKNILISENYLNINNLKFIYKNSNFIIIPSIKLRSGDTEGLPVVLLEALYFGKITISSNESNSGEIITNEKNGFIYDSKIEDSFKLLIQRILKNDFPIREIEKQAEIEGKNYISNNVSKIYYQHLFAKIT